MTKDSITYCTSGLVDRNKGSSLSYLHKAIKSLNQLRMIEDSLVIYRLSRAPERRIFYIDVGNLPKVKAEQYLRDVMMRYRNKLVYDANTGEIRDDKKFMAMLEDFWLPRREGGRGTEITTLPGGQNLGEITDAENLTADRTLNLNVNDANRTISLSGNLTVSTSATISGTNTGDQTITLTGDVTGTGTSSFSATIGSQAVTFAKIVNSGTTGLSVVGRSANSAGSFDEISAASDGQILRRSGNAIAFGNINLSSSNAVGTTILNVNNGGIGTSTASATDSAEKRESGDSVPHRRAGDWRQRGACVCPRLS